MFLLVSLPMCNAAVALWKTLCVSARTSDLLLSAKQWKISPQPFSQSQPRYAAHSSHAVAVLWHFDRVNLIECPIVLIINAAVMEAIFSIFPQITESSPIEKHQTAKRGESLKVNITSSWSPFQREWDFPYLSVFSPDPSTGEETMIDFSFPVDTFPKLERKTDESGHVFKSLCKWSHYN